MTKEVLLSLAGLQYEMDEEALEVVTPAVYYKRNGKNYVTYEEFSEETGECTKVMLKFSEGRLEMTKHGESNVHMLFEVGKKDTAVYEMPFGALAVGIHTISMDYSERENEIAIRINYGLELNYSHVSDCTIRIRVEAKNGSAVREEA